MNGFDIMKKKFPQKFVNRTNNQVINLLSKHKIFVFFIIIIIKYWTINAVIIIFSLDYCLTRLKVSLKYLFS